MLHACCNMCGPPKANNLHKSFVQRSLCCSRIIIATGCGATITNSASSGRACAFHHVNYHTNRLLDIMFVSERVVQHVRVMIIQTQSATGIFNGTPCVIILTRAFAIESFGIIL